MRQTNMEMKKQYQKMDINKIEVRVFGAQRPSHLRRLSHASAAEGCMGGQDVRDDMEDMLEQANEIQEVMSRSYGLPDGLDEDSLDAGAPLGRAV